jgi:hypothetical protein
MTAVRDTMRHVSCGVGTIRLGQAGDLVIRSEELTRIRARMEEAPGRNGPHPGAELIDRYLDVGDLLGNVTTCETRAPRTRRRGETELHAGTPAGALRMLGGEPRTATVIPPPQSVS